MDKNLKVNQKGSWIYFTYNGKHLTEEEAKEIQSKAGYSWLGYGFYCLTHSTKFEEKTILTTTWECSSSCD